MLEYFWKAALRKGEIYKMSDSVRKKTVEHWIMTEMEVVSISWDFWQEDCSTLSTSYTLTGRNVARPGRECEGNE